MEEPRQRQCRSLSECPNSLPCRIFAQMCCIYTTHRKKGIFHSQPDKVENLVGRAKKKKRLTNEQQQNKNPNGFYKWSDALEVEVWKGRFTHSKITDVETHILAGIPALLGINPLKIAMCKTVSYPVLCWKANGSKWDTKGTTLPVKIFKNQDACPWFVRTHLNLSPSSLPSLCVFQTESHYILQAGIELKVIFSSQSPKCRGLVLNCISISSSPCLGVQFI